MNDTWEYDGTKPGLGTTFGLQLSSLASQPGLAVLALGTDIGRWNGTALPLGLRGAGLPGCQLWIAPLVFTPVVHGGAGATFMLPIPNRPTLAGTRLAAQALVFDAGAGNGVATVSNAGVATMN